jgi:hypothetical protein
MRGRRSVGTGWLLVVAGLSGTAAAEEIRRLEDPALLERLGFRGAESLSITADALAGLERELEMEAAGIEAWPGEERQAPAAIAAEVGYSIVTPATIQPVDPTAIHYITTLPTLACGEGDTRFEAQIPELPHGGRLTGGRIWYADSSSAQSLTAIVYRSCLPESSAGTPTTTTLRTHVSSGDSGNRSVALALDEPIDLLRCAYLLRIRLGAECSLGLGFSKVRFEWTPPAEAADPKIFASGFEAGGFDGWSAWLS